MEQINVEKSFNQTSRNFRSRLFSKNFENIDNNETKNVKRKTHYLRLSKKYLTKSTNGKEKTYRLMKTQLPTAKMVKIAQPELDQKTIACTKTNLNRPRFYSTSHVSNPDKKSKDQKLNGDIMQLVKCFHEFNINKYETIKTHSSKDPKRNFLNNNLFKKIIK